MTMRSFFARVRNRGLALLAALVSAALAASPAAAGFIKAGGSIVVLEAHPGGLVGSKTIAATGFLGQAAEERAEFGQGFVNFGIFPQTGTAGIGGISHPIKFEDFSGFQDESVTEASCEIQDSLHLTGPISGTISGQIVFSISGSLM